MFTFPEIKFPAWWGTEVIKNTADVLGTPLRTLEQGYILSILKPKHRQRIGPSVW